MSRTIRQMAFGLLAVTLLLGAMPADLHLRLERAEPAVDGEITAAPDAIRLYFSQEPQIKLTTVKLTDGSGAEVQVGDAMAVGGDGKVVAAAVKGEMKPGKYTVVWRTMAKDGHVVRGEFAFSLRAAD